MIKAIKKLAIGGLMIGLLISASLAISVPLTVSAADIAKPATECNGRFLTLPAWYNGLAGPKDDCGIISPAGLEGDETTQLSRFIWKAVLNVVGILLQIIGYVAIGFVIYGGFKYVSSTGRPDKVKEGRELILNAVIGLVISFFAATAVGYIGANL